MSELIIVRGGGDLATGVIHKLWTMNKRILILETEQPSAIRRLVAFSEAIYECSKTVEGVTVVRVDVDVREHQLDELIISKLIQQLEMIWDQKQIPIIVDPYGTLIEVLSPTVLIDAIIAKKNLGTHRDMAPLTIALGPGFEASIDVDYVIETMRGSTLGQIIQSGAALPNTGVPGMIGGKDKERVIHAPCGGILKNVRKIGDILKQGEVIAVIETREQSIEIIATIDGVLRGLIRDGYSVNKGCKIADIDPRLEELENIDKISDKAKCIAESVIEKIYDEIG